VVWSRFVHEGSMADDPPPVTPKNEKHASLISREAPMPGTVASVRTPTSSLNPPKSHPVLDAIASILLVALFIALAVVLGFVAYWLMPL
jgi:hypothetical protein